MGKIDRIMTTKEAAEMCMVSMETIRRWIKERELKAYNTIGRSPIRIKLSDLEEFAKKYNILLVQEDTMHLEESLVE